MLIVQRSFCVDGFPPLGEADVHIWLTHLDRSTCEAELRQLLTDEEAVRAARYKMARVQRQFIVGRGLLRKTLGHYLQASPRQIRIDYGPTGKPFVADGHIEFNLSHVDEWALLGLAHRKRIGIDLEPLRPVDNMTGLIDRFFAPTERATFHALPSEWREQAFFRGWTCKEAVLKALGLSVQSLDRFDVEMDPRQPPRLLRLEPEIGDASNWALGVWQPCLGHLAAVALECVDAIEVRAADHARPLCDPCCLHRA